MVAAAVALLGGCGDDEAKPRSKGAAAFACDEVTKAVLKAPATYDRLGYEAVRGKGVADITVTVSFDVQNALGVPLRKLATCRFYPWTTKTRPQLVVFRVDGRDVEGTDLSRLGLIVSQRFP